MTPTDTETPTASTADAGTLAEIDRALRSEGPGAALDRLVRVLEDRGDYRALLDALLLKARVDLGLPPILSGSLNELPDPTRSKYEDRYVEAIRIVGGRFLERGDIPGAWPYFRAISEPAPVASALDSYEPDANGDERLGKVIEVAFNEGANPRRGFGLILRHYGACSAITAFEGLPPDPTTRALCAGELVRHLRDSLAFSLRTDIERRGQPVPPETASIPELLEGRDWLFEDEAYHLDVSHLASVVRMTPLLNDPDVLRLAVELAEYGRRLSPRHQYESDPPFDKLYDDHRIYLRALLGDDADGAVAHFRAKLDEPDPYGDATLARAQTLTRLLVRLNRLDEAIDVAAKYFPDAPESLLTCPSLPQLCRMAGRPERLAESARDRGDLVAFTAARLAERSESTPTA